MKISISIILSFFFFQLLPAQGAEHVLPLEALAGKWYINQSNFPMWLKGDKTHPTFNYTIEKRKDILGLKDEVIYSKKGQQKKIVGFDTPINETQTEFVWRGKGILGIAKSKWKVLYLDMEENWGIIEFEKTLFTPAGYDVISRDKILSPDLLKTIERVLETLEVRAELEIIEQGVPSDI